MDKVQPELMKPIRAFAAMDISKSKGYEALQRGEIPFIRIAGQIRIPRAWVERKIKQAIGSFAGDSTSPDASSVTGGQKGNLA